MLTHLTVKNLALIDHAELTFGAGLTVLTGETGAGKSILVEALLLLLGQRADASVIRQGATDGSVEAAFTLRGTARASVCDALDDAGLPALDDDTLVLRRLISREGRHKQTINGSLCTVSQLKAVAEHLVDFTGQHAHQQLVRKGAGLALTDAYAGHDDDVTAMRSAYTHTRAIAQELSTLREKEQEKERRLDVIRFYLDEIEALSPVAGEDEALQAERRRLHNASKLRDATSAALSVLRDGDDDALSRVRQAQHALRRAARDDDSLAALADALDGAVAVVDDVARELDAKGEQASDPARLEEVEDRLDALMRVMKKHGGDLNAVLHAQQELSAEKDLLEQATEHIASLEEKLATATAHATALADALTAARTRAAAAFGDSVGAELPALGMSGAQLIVQVRPQVTGELRTADGRPLHATGADDVELMFSANAGEAAAPLSKVASGGELSRVLLAIKRVLLDKDPVPVSVFDEVDAGVGGAVGEAIGDKLKAIAHSQSGDGRQVMCITHLAQIAARGDQHLVVSKAMSDGRTRSQVREVSGGDREGEVARMLGGKEITAATLTHAKELLSLALVSSAKHSAAEAQTPAPPKESKSKRSRSAPSVP